MLFLLGRHKGAQALEKRPYWKQKAAKVFHFLERHQIWVILGFRFFYGLRNVTPFVIGVSGFAPLKFLVLNGLGAALWAISFGVLGYLLGKTFELFISKAQRYEMAALGIIVLLAFLTWLIYLWNGYRKANSPQEGDK